MLDSKKSQVVVFVIVGLVMLIVAIFLFSSGKLELFMSHDAKLKNQISEVVKDCIYDSANDGAYLLGAQGGVIEISPFVSANPFMYTDFGMKIPNWDVTRGNIPTIVSMETELSNYVSENSLGCIKSNLKTLGEVLDIEFDDEENFGVVARINKENVIVESNFLIRFNEKGSEEILTVEDYVVKLDELRLGDLYNLAVEIYNVELATYVFEDLVIDQIRSADDYSNPNSMPTEGMIFTCGQRYWTIEQLKKNLANLNNNNFKYLQFEGTYSKDAIFEMNLNDEFGNAWTKQYFDKIYKVDIENKQRSFKNYNVDVFMPSTEITSKEGYIQRYPYRTFEVTPSSGQIVKSMQVEVKELADLPIPCIQIFHHLYDLDYDLIIKLTDYNEDGQGYFFQFPLRVEIRNNEPKQKSIYYLDVEPKTFNEENYCQDENYLYPMLVMTTDNEGNSLADVNISYKCISVKCELGSTSKPSFMGIERKYAFAQLETKFPFCVGGQVIGEKSGYHYAEKRVVTDKGLLGAETYVGSNLVELELIPKKKFDVGLETFLIMPKEVSTSQRVMTKDDGAIFVLIESLEHDFYSQAMWPNEEGFLDVIELLDEGNVTYNLSVAYIDGNNDLKGMLEIDGWTPEIHKGNRIVFKIPATMYPVTEDNYVEFYEHTMEQSNSSDFEPLIY